MARGPRKSLTDGCEGVSFLWFGAGARDESKSRYNGMVLALALAWPP